MSVFVTSLPGSFGHSTKSCGESGRCRKPREGRSAGLSERTIHAIHVTLNGALAYAVEAGALRPA
jgi:hypothetical protein